jgi:type II secretory pathway predicted ATPase ExeA
MNYLDFYRLSREPFSNEPTSSRFYFDSDEHHRAYVRIMHAIENRRGLALLVGDIGTGKTTVARKVLRSLDENLYSLSMLVVVQTHVDSFDFLKKIAAQLGVKTPSGTKQEAIRNICERLIELDSQKKKTVLLIDEAQMLKSKEIMEDLRGLLNIETIEKKLLTIILFGLPEIETNLRLDPPLSQRVAVKYHLGALSLTGTREYIDFKLQAAEAKDYLFTKEAYYAIHQ